MASLDELLKQQKTMTMEELLRELMSHAQNMRGFIVAHHSDASTEEYFDAKESFGCVESCFNELLSRINPKA